MSLKNLTRNSLSGKFLSKNRKIGGLLDPLGIFAKKKPAPPPPPPVAPEALQAMRTTLMASKVLGVK